MKDNHPNTEPIFCRDDTVCQGCVTDGKEPHDAYCVTDSLRLRKKKDDLPRGVFNLYCLTLRKAYPDQADLLVAVANEVYGILNAMHTQTPSDDPVVRRFTSEEMRQRHENWKRGDIAETEQGQ